MNTGIFIPKMLKAGYQYRDDTFTGKLAYIIYYDEKNKLRKEKSWNSWRNKNISANNFMNSPITGLILNKPAGGVEHSYGWNARKSYCRVYDPRGFEIEITTENLLYLLANNNYNKDTGFEGSYVYGFDGTELVLIPTNSNDYIEIKEYNDKVIANNGIKAKDLVIGNTYLSKSGDKLIYMGYFDTYRLASKYSLNGKSVIAKKDSEIPNNTPYTLTYILDKKKYWFCNANYITENSINRVGFSQYVSIANNKFVKCIDNTKHPLFDTLNEKMKENPYYSPEDRSKDEYVSISFEDFCKKLDDYNSIYFISDFIDKTYKSYKIVKNSNRFSSNILKYSIKVFDKNNMNAHEYYSYDNGYTLIDGKFSYNQINIFEDIKSLYEFVNPKLLNIYSTNGNLMSQDAMVERYYYKRY